MPNTDDDPRFHPLETFGSAAIVEALKDARLDAPTPHALVGAVEAVRADPQDQDLQGVIQALTKLTRFYGRYDSRILMSVKDQSEEAKLLQKVVDEAGALRALGAKLSDPSGAALENGDLRPGLELAAKIAEEDWTPAYGPHNNNMEWFAEAQRKGIANRIRACIADIAEARRQTKDTTHA